MSKAIEHQLIQTFKDRKQFSRSELLAFFRSIEPDLKDSTFRWRIYNLKNKNLLLPLKKDSYTLIQKPYFVPSLSQPLQTIMSKLSSRIGDLRHCYWETNWLNEFTQHQSNKSIRIIEVEHDYEEAVFYEMRDLGFQNTYLKPARPALRYTIHEAEQPIIIQRLISRAPIQKMDTNKYKPPVPTIEKILVDIFSDKDLHLPYQGSELIYIYENTIASYAVNFTTLLSYAKRRDRKAEILDFIMEHLSSSVKDILND